MLKLASSHPDFFAHSGRSAVKHGEAFGCNCAKCGRDVSAPFGFEGKMIWCLYCGMEFGLVPEIENPWGGIYTFGVTRDECIEDFAALDRGDIDDVQERRARKAGRVLNLF